MRKIAEFNTSMGNFKVELFGDKAPLTVGNFMKLVDKGFYKGLTFHRVIDKFIIQGGCPHGTGRGGPGYTIRDEFHSSLKHLWLFWAILIYPEGRQHYPLGSLSLFLSDLFVHLR